MEKKELKREHFYFIDNSNREDFAGIKCYTCGCPLTAHFNEVAYIDRYGRAYCFLCGHVQVVEKPLW